ncbi:MAG TPA: hypothetical protein QGF58_14510 [Myxococcota bacterium]|nr:hypothetical protein [Myxococcota bacterium]
MLALLALLACGPSFHEVQKADSIEAYEAFIQAAPNSPSITMAEIRLEELYLEKARKDKTLEAYDHYLEMYQGNPKSQLAEIAVEEREEFLYAWAEDSNSVEAWQTWLDEYPKGSKKRKQEARRRVAMNAYVDQLEIGRVEIEPVNLAEDPDGALDGYLFTSEVTNTGTRTITTLNMELQYLDIEGNVIDKDRWPLVAPQAPGNMPIEEEWKVPVKPGETRAYWYTDMAPEAVGWSKKARLVPISVTFEGD